MSIIQISKIQQRAGDLVDLPQLDEAELGFATDTKQLFIGKESPNENIEVLTSYSEIAFDQIEGSQGNLDISSLTVANGQVLAFDGNNWVNRGGNAGGLINLGGNANVKISGGAIGYVLTTDGTGNLIWAPKTTVIGYIKDVSSASPAVITTTSNVEFVNDSFVTISGILGNATNSIGTQLNGNSYYLQVLTPNTFALYNSPTAGSPVDTTGNNFPFTSVTGTSSTNDRVTVADTTGFAVNDPIIFLGNDFNNTGITANNTYYVKQIISGTELTISETVAGTILELSTKSGLTGCEAYTPGGQAVSLVTSGSGNVGASSTDTTIQYNKNNILGGSSSFTYDYNTSVLGLTGNANITGNVNVTANVLSSRFFSNVANGTAPLTVVSQTKVANLNVDLLDGYDASLTATANTVVVRDANASIAANNFTGSNISVTGTLSVTGNANVGNIGATNGVFTANVTAGNVFANSGTVSASLLTGTLTTAAQPNITSVGTLSSLTVSANIIAGNVFANSGRVSASLLTGTLTTAAQPNITSVGTLTSLAVSGNLSAGNISTVGVITGNGSGLSALTGANVTGQVGNALVAGTVYTNAQPNITSVGTLTSLNVTGNVTTSSGRFISLVSTGTAPLMVSSNTVVANLNADLVDGYDTSISSVANTIVVRDANANIAANRVLANDINVSNITSGNATFTNLTVTGNSSSGNITISDTANITTLLTRVITTGANTTTGNITGNWTLTTGSRLQATYADLAEYYSADANYAAGTVLAFGGEFEVTVAGIETNKVAGVVSAEPAYVMNSMINCKYPVALALQGRVPCKVKGKVRKGNMMVSAGGGYAKAAITSPNMGTVIGKALQDFDGEEGIIEVVVGRL